MTMSNALKVFYDYKAGESIVKEESNSQLTDPLGKSHIGILVFTNYRLLFWSHQNPVNLGKSQFYDSKNVAETSNDVVLNLPLGFIQEFEKADAYTINIKCKDFRSVSLKFKNCDTGGERFHKILERHLNPRSYGIKLFSYVHFEALQGKTDPGYYQLVLNNEIQRTLRDRDHWRITKINHNFEICETYPDEVGVPQDVSDDLITNACQFRTKSRFPVLCWIHPDSKATLTRSSQPATGMTWKRNDYDERFLKCIKDANAYNNLLTIIDCRPMINARANMARGGGIENQSIYSSISYEFLNIPNIHVMRESQRKLADLAILAVTQDNSGAWQKALEETRWLNYIRQILLGALMVAEKINSQRSVLVHCSDGWDRSSQIVSLPQIMLDPYFRTIRGFQILVDKEWLLMGHKISQRTGGLSEETSSAQSMLAQPVNPTTTSTTNASTPIGGDSVNTSVAASQSNNATASASNGGNNMQTNTSSNVTNPKSERSPIILQFIDCVWQMTQQFPSAFEFNEQFLIDLMDAVHSGLYGNFLFNCEQQRRQNDIYNKTLSFWSHVNNDIGRYRNPLYTSADESGHRVLFPQYRLPCIKFWSGYYMRHYLPSRKQDPILEYNRILSQRMKLFQQQLNKENEYDGSDSVIAGGNLRSNL